VFRVLSFFGRSAQSVPCVARNCRLLGFFHVLQLRRTSFCTSSCPSGSTVSNMSSSLTFCFGYFNRTCFPPLLNMSFHNSSLTSLSPSLSAPSSVRMEFDLDAIDDEDSPYPEVRASVSNIDDPDMPALTLRMWIVGLILCMFSTLVSLKDLSSFANNRCHRSLNVFFNFRAPAPSVVPLVLLLISYPFGKFLAFTMPITTYRIPIPHLPPSIVPLPNIKTSRIGMLCINLIRPLTYTRNIEFSLNPGPWNIKEHVLVYIMANVAIGNPYALNAVVVSEMYYGIKLGYWFAVVLVLATQLTGFGLAGLCRRFLVWPASMVWPQNLVACTLLNTLHAEDEDDGIGTSLTGERRKGMTRYRFYIILTVSSFFFFFLPGTNLPTFLLKTLKLTPSCRLFIQGTFYLLIRLLGGS